MIEKDIVLVFESLLCAALIVWFFSRPWQRLWTNISRQHLFELRDQLFDMAAEQRIDFSDTAYCQLREHLNGFIRFAHKITLGSLIVGIVCLESRTREKYNIEKTIENITDENVRHDMRVIFRKSVFILLRHMAIRSPLGWALWFLLPFILILANFYMIVEKADLIDSQLNDLILAQENLDSSSRTLHSHNPSQAPTG